MADIEKGSNGRDGRDENPVALICLLLVSGTSLGIIIGLARYLVGDMQVSPLHLAATQNVAAGLLIFVFMRNRRSSLGLVKTNLAYFVATSAFGIAIPHAIVYLAVDALGVAIMGSVYLIPPLLTYCLALVVGFDTFDKVRFAALVIGLAGTAMLFADREFTPDATLFWLAIAMLAPLAMAVGNLHRSIYWPPGLAIAPFASTMLFVAGSLLAIVGVAIDGLPSLHALCARYAAALAGCVAAAIVGYLAFVALQRRAGPVYVSQGGYVVAASSLVFGLLIFAERLSLLALGGIAVIAIAVGQYAAAIRAKAAGASV